jgi:hypothetical protein
VREQQLEFPGECCGNAECRKPLLMPLRCAQCRTVAYCTKECQVCVCGCVYVCVCVLLGGACYSIHPYTVMVVRFVATHACHTLCSTLPYQVKLICLLPARSFTHTRLQSLIHHLLSLLLFDTARPERRKRGTNASAKHLCVCK